MDTPVKVSVIIPVYNVEKYLEQCLESVLNQTLQDIEVICVDDGSTDSSLSILRKYEKQDSRVKVICQKNKFAGGARNVGMKIATGKYFVFLDSDDFFERDLLDEQYQLCCKYDADICLCAADKYDIRTQEFQTASHYLNVTRIQSLVGDKKVFSVTELGDMIFSIASPAPWNKMFSADFVKTHGLKFQETQRANDSFFTQVAINLAQRVTYTDKVLVHYRVGMTTNLQSNNSTSPFDFCKALQATKERLILEGKYEQVEKGFINNVLSQFDYNLSTLIDRRRDAYLQLLGALKNEYIYSFSIADKKQTYFYNKACYWRVMEQLEAYDQMNAQSQVPVYEKLALAYKQEVPLVSVVIPIYNVEEFLPECIESVQKQTLKKIEIICVNDGSPDTSLEIAEKYAMEDSRITVISQKNGGLSSARNTGLKYARGKYVYFLDSDDFILSETMEALYQQAETEQLDILLFGAETIFESEEVRERNLQYIDYYNRTVLFDRAVPGDTLLAESIEKNCFRSSVPLQFFNRDFLAKSGVCFKEGICHEDELFSVLILIEAQRVRYIADRFYIRRVRMDSIMTVQPKAKHFAGKFIVYTSLIAKAITTENLSSAAKKGLLKQAEKMRASATRVYKQLSEREKEKIKAQLPDEFNFLYKEMGFSESSPARDAKELRTIKSSVAYRIGCALTYIPKKIRGGIQCYKDNGMRYTIHRIFEKAQGRLKKMLSN